MSELEELMRLWAVQPQQALHARGGESMPLERIYTPRDLAERWGVSDTQVRRLIKRGELEAFLVGANRYRIKRSAVEKFECQTAKASELECTEENGAPSGPSTVNDIDAFSQALKHVSRPKLKFELPRHN